MDEWCPVDGCPASICNGPHLEHQCVGDFLTSMSVGNTEPCPWCGWVPLTEVEVPKKLDRSEWSSPARVVVEWGLQTNCAKNGCDPFHSDDGRVFSQGARPTEAWPVNRHATDVVMRTVTYASWEVVEGG